MVRFILMRHFVVLFILIASTDLSGQESTGQAKSATAKIEYQNRTFVGQPLAWDGTRVAMLSLDGRLNFIPAKSQSELEVVSDTFQPYSVQQLRASLWDQFHERYDVSTTEHYVVVHPWGDAKIWARPFEDFHAAFVEYFGNNGVELREPTVPMIALVLRSRNDFDRSLINEVDVRDSRIGGFYSRISNRITTYDPAGVIRVGDDKWMYSAWPVIHEATHQSAFNTGLHNRFAPPPVWLSEGLATMFEARAFERPADFSRPGNRFNRRRLQSLRKYLNTDDLHAGLVNMVANDKLFSSHPELAYSLSWGLSFYLAETQREEYFRFLERDGKRPNFTPYPQQERLQDFANAFGDEFEEIETGLKDFFSKR